MLLLYSFGVRDTLCYIIIVSDTKMMDQAEVPLRNSNICCISWTL